MNRTEPRVGPVIGVVGGSGGVGASFFAAVLAVVAGPSVLIDLDVTGGGIDVVLGIERVDGARWSGLRVAGGHLDPRLLVEGLPRVGQCAVLAADTAVIEAAAAGQVIEAAATLGPVIVDLPRAACAERAAALLGCDLVVVLARADVGGLVAAHAMVSALPELPIGVVVRRGELGPHEAAEMVGAALLGVLPALSPGGLDFDPVRLPRPPARVAAGVLAGLGGPRRDASLTTRRAS